MMTDLSYNINPSYSSIDEREMGIRYFKKIYDDVHERRFNFLGMITGKHRTAKSLSAVTWSCILDPTFMDNLEQRVVYFAGDFMKTLQQIKKDELYGAAIVWDEAGVGIPARDWYDISNKSISMTLQVFGRYLPIVFFVTPDVSYIDSQARKLFHGFYEMSRTSNQFAIARPFNVNYNKRTGKVYYVYPRMNIPNGDALGLCVTMNNLMVMRPSPEFEKRYEDHSIIFKSKIIDQMDERTNKYNQGKIDSKRMTIEEIVRTVVDGKDNVKYLNKRSKKDGVSFDINAIRYGFGIPDGLARLVKHHAELEVNSRVK